MWEDGIATRVRVAELKGNACKPAYPKLMVKTLPQVLSLGQVKQRGDFIAGCTWNVGTSSTLSTCAH